MTVTPVHADEQLMRLHETAKRLEEGEGMYDIPEHPKMDYEDIFGVPRAYKTKGLGIHIGAGVDKVFGGAFNYTQSTMYYIITMILGLFLGFIWGLLFGIIIFFVNWIVHPIYKIVFIFLQLGGTMITPFIRITLDPIFQSCGECLKTIKGKMEVKLRTVNVDVNQLPSYPEVSQAEKL